VIIHRSDAEDTEKIKKAANRKDATNAKSDSDKTITAFVFLTGQQGRSVSLFHGND
jgi:hypothetical protein